jgi:hypothetical protein
MVGNKLCCLITCKIRHIICLEKCLQLMLRFDLIPERLELLLKGIEQKTPFYCSFSTMLVPIMIGESLHSLQWSKYISTLTMILAGKKPI